MSDADSARTDSFGESGTEGISAPSYTRPADFRGLKVPEVLLSGDHAKIAAWRAEQGRIRTEERKD
jgi:tRNA (guanine37-N1)-methyltransferase